MPAQVSVVMSNYNGVQLGLIEQSVESIINNTYPNLEVIVIDNASTDTSVQVLQKKFGKNPRFHLLQNPVNMYSLGLNLGIKNSTGKYVAFFNNDAYVDNGYFEKMVAFMESHKNVALSQSKLLSSKNRKVIDCVGETMDIFGNPASIGHGQKDTGQYERQMDILSVTGSCSMLRKSVAKTVGYFDNDYGIGYEDMDLALRARRHDFAIAYIPGAYVYHKRGATDLSPKIKNTVKFHFNKNRIVTIIKNFSTKDIIKTLPLIVVFYICAGIFEMIIKDNFPVGLSRFTSLFWILTNLSPILEKRKKIQKMQSAKYMKTIYNLLIQKKLFSMLFTFAKEK